jgi:hypothetical protein
MIRPIRRLPALLSALALAACAACASTNTNFVASGVGLRLNTNGLIVAPALTNFIATNGLATAADYTNLLAAYGAATNELAGYKLALTTLSNAVARGEVYDFLSGSGDLATGVYNFAAVPTDAGPDTNSLVVVTNNVAPSEITATNSPYTWDPGASLYTNAAGAVLAWTNAVFGAGWYLSTTGGEVHEMNPFDNTYPTGLYNGDVRLDWGRTYTTNTQPVSVLSNAVAFAPFFVTNRSPVFYAPRYKGDLFVDTGSNLFYFAVGLSTSDWKAPP